jgi:hypothetical protein
MAVSQQRITVSTTAVALHAVDKGGLDLVLKNTSANAADVGGAGVTAGTGFDLAAGATVNVRVKPGDQLFAIRSAGADAVIAVVRT